MGSVAGGPWLAVISRLFCILHVSIFKIWLWELEKLYKTWSILQMQMHCNFLWSLNNNNKAPDFAANSLHHFDYFCINLPHFDKHHWVPLVLWTLFQPHCSFLHPSSLAHPPDSLPDSLLLWLAGELSEEEVALLALSLRLRRSAAQLVKLRAGDSLSTQAFHVLAVWRRALPAAPHQPKASQLAHCLAKSGRPDLARELLLRQAGATRQSSLK